MAPPIFFCQLRPWLHASISGYLVFWTFEKHKKWTQIYLHTSVWWHNEDIIIFFFTFRIFFSYAFFFSFRFIFIFIITFFFTANSPWFIWGHNYFFSPPKFFCFSIAEKFFWDWVGILMAPLIFTKSHYMLNLIY